MGSRGSIIPFFSSIIGKGPIPITDERMTRFMISIEEGVELVWHAFDDMIGGEIYVKKIPSMKVTDIADTIAPNVKHKIIGILPGEKLHEQMISAEDSYSTYEYPNHYKILPQINEWGKDVKRIKDGIKVSEGFVYSSETNSQWMTKEYLRTWLDKNKNLIGKL
jgi:FlaA1/EpsC-like NDP-sugar epimerase